MELLLNIIHYCIYKADTKRHLFSNKLNPFVLLGKIPAVKKNFNEQGTTHLDVVNKIWGDKRYGFSILISGAVLVITLFLVILSVFDLANSFLKYPTKSSFLPFAICILIAYAICHFTVFKEDKYLKYFKQFETWSEKDKWKYGLISFAFVACSVFIWIYSFRFLPKT